MFSAIRKHLNPATVVAFMALVFAMTGGAFAATGGGGAGAKASSSVTPSAAAAKAKAKPKAKAGPRGPAGPAGKNGATGATGAAGAQGPAGAAGAKGEAGAAGATGAIGAQGPQGEQGAPGAEGAEGPAGPLLESLPSGKTLKGVYATSGYGEAGFPNAGYGLASTGVSFVFPVVLNGGSAGGSAFHYIKKGEAPPAGCTGGTFEAPTAEPGNLCIYGEIESNQFERSVDRGASTVGWSAGPVQRLCYPGLLRGKGIHLDGRHLGGDRGIAHALPADSWCLGSPGRRVAVPGERRLLGRKALHLWAQSIERRCIHQRHCYKD